VARKPKRETSKTARKQGFARSARRKGQAAASGLAAALRRLADQRAIEDGLVAYAHALDERDYARLSALFTSDARVKYGEADWLVGVPATARYVAAALDPLEMSQHRLSSIAVALDGDRATSKAYLCAEHVRAGERYTVGGHYLDAWERTPAGWRIAERRLVTTWTDGNPAVLRGVQLGDEGA
jgi:3-phenylpropionate/cinnamic acid dioxygenase small subunit